MALDRILIAGFRNHRNTALEGTARFNLLVGENGAGKTNVLEALSLLAPGRGLRRAQLADMAAHGLPAQGLLDQGKVAPFAISAALITGQAPVQIGTGTLPDRPGRRVVQINQAETPAVRLGEWLSIQWLTPAMDRLFTEGAGSRRRFLDRLVLALEPAHARNAARAETALRERNRLLSDPAEPDPAWLDAIEAQLAEAGSALAAARASVVARLAEALEALPPGPFARPTLAYSPGGPIEPTALAAELKAGRRRDRAAQRTLIGPHRDDLVVTLAGKDQPAAECSTGEQKAMLIAIVLAHASLNGTADARPSLLLLDEVAAHLDPVRRTALFDRLRHGSAQVWLTGTELAPFDAIRQEAAIWTVRDGEALRL